MMNVISKSFIFTKNLKEINLKSKKDNTVDNKIGDIGCITLFKNTVHLTNLEELNLNGNREIKKIECGITSESSAVMNENIKYLIKLKGISLNCKNENKVDNKIRDDGCKAIFNRAKYLSNLEQLDLYCNIE